MWILLNHNIYFWLAIVLVALIAAIRVIWETRSPSKTAAYLLLILLFPLGGSIIYFLVGVNYRKRRIYSKKIFKNEALFNQLKQRILNDSKNTMQKWGTLVSNHRSLIYALLGESLSPLSENKVTLLSNGEEKFPQLLESLGNAKKFIHLEYYIFEDDEIGNRIKEVLIQKARNGVHVRLIFDDFGSHDLWDHMVPELRAAGVQVFPFYRIHFILFANRINYRDHRKVVIIDGHIGFIGGINIADRYVNPNSSRFWRDTHLKIEGNAVLTLQYHFISNWNFCSGETLSITSDLFPVCEIPTATPDLVQIVTSGPDYPSPSIMLCFMQAIMSAKRSVYITTPYFIPNESILNAIKTTAFSGKEVIIILPERSDSKVTDAASRFYFQDLLEAGIKIYRYQKGIIHAKTMVIDDNLSIVGTANMDHRSFELNFEMNAIVYSNRLNEELKKKFLEDLTHSQELDLAVWLNRNKIQAFFDALARILAPLL